MTDEEKIKQAEELLDQGKFKEAIELVDQVIQTAPDNPAALTIKGKAIGSLGDHQKAFEIFSKASEIEPANIEINNLKTTALYNWGNALSDQARKKEGKEADALFEKAYQKYDQALKIKPDLHEALYNWGNALLDQARKKIGEEADALFEKAYQKYEQALKIKPDKHEALNNWGNALLDQARKKIGEEADALFEKAYQKYAQALKIKPDLHEALYNWGTALSDQARKKTGKEADALFEKAYQKYEQALKIKPDLHEALYNWGTALSDQAGKKDGKEAEHLLEQALARIEQAIKLNDKDADYWAAKGWVHIQLKDHKKALDAFLKASELGHPDKTELSYFKSLCHYHLGNYSEAERLARGAFQKRKKDDSFIFIMALIELEKKNYRSALNYLEKAISLKPGKKEYILWRAYINYLAAEFSLKNTLDKERQKRELALKAEIVRLTSELARQAGFIKNDDRLSSWFYYFQAFLFEKLGDIYSAMESLKQCLEKCKDENQELHRKANFLLGCLWNHKIKQSWWRWWLAEPRSGWRILKRLIFGIGAAVMIAEFALLVLTTIIPKDWFYFLNRYLFFADDWHFYLLALIVPLFFLMSPIIARLRAGAVEMEFQPPAPPVEPVIPLSEISKSLQESALAPAKYIRD